MEKLIQLYIKSLTYNETNATIKKMKELGGYGNIDVKMKISLERTKEHFDKIITFLEDNYPHYNIQLKNNSL